MKKKRKPRQRYLGPLALAKQFHAKFRKSIKTKALRKPGERAKEDAFLREDEE